MHRGLVVLVTSLFIAWSYGDPAALPLLPSALKMPAISISYAAPSNAAAKSITDQKNGQLFQLGCNSIFYSVDWKALETTPGVIDLTPMTTVLKLINQVNSVYPLAVYLLVKTIDTTLIQVPSDLSSSAFELKTGLLWNDTSLVNRYNAVMTAVLDWLSSNPNQVYLVGLGNEVDIWLSSHPNQQAPYASFISQVISHCRQLNSQMAYGVTLTFDNGVANRKNTGFAFVDTLMTLSDVAIVTYYPLQSNFFVRDPSTASADVATIVSNTDANKRIVMQEVGYPSGYEPTSSDGSSLQKQSDFVAAFFNATLLHLSRFAQINWFLLVDVNLGIDYGINNAQFKEYLDTIGLMRPDGTARPALDQFQASLVAIRSGTATPVGTTPPASTTTKPAQSSDASDTVRNIHKTLILLLVFAFVAL